MGMKRLLEDAPRDGSDTAPDELDRERFTGDLAKVLDRLHVDSSSGVVAIIAPWGAGKSSVAEMLLRRLQSDSQIPKWRVARFNPWLHSNVATMIPGLFSEIRSVLPKNRRWNTRRDTLSDWVRAVSPLGSLGMIFGMNATPVLAGTADILGTSLSEKRQAVEATLKKLDYPILVFIDDLDRLFPEELLTVFKMVRQIGNLPNLYYLLSYDERTLVDILNQTDLIGPDQDRALAYLEKIVQVRVDLPDLREFQARALFYDAVQEFARRHAITLDDQWEKLWDLFDLFVEKLSTPRAIKRLIGQIDSFYSMHGNEVNLIDYVGATYMRTFYPSAFRALPRLSKLLTGRDMNLMFLSPSHGRPTPEQVRETIQQRFLDAKVEVDVYRKIRPLLEFLFPYYRHIIRDNSLPNPIVTQATFDKRGIGDPYYFERYFAFGVPGEDLPDSLYELAWAELQAGGSGPNLSAVADYSQRDAQIIVRKMLRVSMKGNSWINREVLALGRWFGELHETSLEHYLGSPSDRALEYSLSDVLQLCIADEQVASFLTSQAAKSSRRAYWVGAAISRALELGDGLGCISSVHEAIPEVARSLEHFVSGFGTNFRTMTDEEFSLIYAWRRTDSISLKKYLQDEASRNPEIAGDVLARLVHAAPGGQFEGPDLEYVEAILGVEFAYEACASDIEAVSSQGAASDLADFDARRDRAIRAIARAKLVRDGTNA